MRWFLKRLNEPSTAAAGAALIAIGGQWANGQLPGAAALAGAVAALAGIVRAERSR